MQNGDVYGGFFKDNEFDGEGVYLYNHGDIFSGQLLRNQRTGMGTYFYKSKQCIYSGEWLGNVKQGYGRLLLSNNVRAAEGGRMTD